MICGEVLQDLSLSLASPVTQPSTVPRSQKLTPELFVEKQILRICHLGEVWEEDHTLARPRMHPEFGEWPVFFQQLGPEHHFFTDTWGGPGRGPPQYHRQHQRVPAKARTGLGSNGDTGQARTETRVYSYNSELSLHFWRCVLRKMAL